MNWDGRLGNTSFNVDYLQSVTVEEAIAALTTEHVSANRVVNAWKKANPTKSAKISKKK